MAFVVAALANKITDGGLFFWADNVLFPNANIFQSIENFINFTPVSYEFRIVLILAFKNFISCFDISECCTQKGQVGSGHFPILQNKQLLCLIDVETQILFLKHKGIRKSNCLCLWCSFGDKKAFESFDIVWWPEWLDKIAFQDCFHFPALLLVERSIALCPSQKKNF